MSNDDGKNFIMKIHMLLIVLDFTQICVSLETNISIQNDPRNYVTLLRGKRQAPEYTRWQSNLETTKREFIVKVEDEGFNPTRSTPIVGINVQSATNADRLIIGGVIVPPVSTSRHDTTPVEYTRFVPPTTVRITGSDDVIYTQIKGAQGYVPPLSQDKQVNRDDRPLAGPHFITRSPALAQQFAPITPVAFYQRATASPVTPPTVTHGFVQFSPSRSSGPSNIEHTRTSLESHNFNMVPQESEDAQDLKDFLSHLARYDLRSDTTATRTSPPSFVTTPTWNKETENIPTKAMTDLDMDAYHMFYNEDDNDVGDGKKKTGKSAGDEDDILIDKQVNGAEDKASEEEKNSLDIDFKENYRRNEDLMRNTSTIDKSTSVSVNRSSIPEKMRTANVIEDQKQPMCSLLKFGALRFNTPQTLPEIVRQLKMWENNTPIAKMIDITANNLTTMDNPIYMMIVDDPSSGQGISAKDIVMIVAGIQGRDHYAVSAAMYVLFQLIVHTDTHADLLKKFRFWVIPVFNPDGYDYSMTFTQRRDWTKNLQQSWEPCGEQPACKKCETHGLRCIVQPCYGVHLDRNFEYQWIPADELRAEHPCGNLYAGARQLSEPETRALTTFLHEQKMSISMFIAFKEGDVLRKKASRAASAAFSISGRPYVAGQTSEFLPLYAGGIEDWVDGHLGIDNSYTIMMFRPSDSHNSKLMTEHIVHEAYAALDTLLLDNNNEPLSVKPLVKPRQESSSAKNILPTIILLPAVIHIFNS